MEQSLKISLFDPGMSDIHRVGLAGLFMALQKIGESSITIGSGSWDLFEKSIELHWSGKASHFFDDLFKKSFGITGDGLLDFIAHRNHPMSDMQRVALSESVRFTFLQHNKFNKIPKGTRDRTISFDFGDKTLIATYKPFLNPYAHSTAVNILCKKNGDLNNNINVKAWLYPGAVERHSGHSGTEIAESPERIIALLFAPMASVYFSIVHKTVDNKFDKRHFKSIIFPHVKNLQKYAKHYGRFLKSSVDLLSAEGVGDAGLSALAILRATDSMEALGVTGCTVVTLGTVNWSKQQKTRTAMAKIENIEEPVIDQFDHAWRCLPNRIVMKKIKDKKKEGKEQNFFVATSVCRGLIAENIAAGQDWFKGFSRLMASGKMAAQVFYENGGLKKMVEETAWDFERDKKLIEAVHIAIRSRYGAIAAQAKNRGEHIRFDREFERIRTGFMRVKNVETLRAELADLFARGGINRILQESWIDILPSFTGDDWQRTRDLALLGLASYSGKGVEIIQTDDENENGEKEERK